jgi:CRISPR-associated protein Cas1
MRGIEGAAATAYFARFDQMLSSPNGFRFDTRSRRPPRNEVNAVLSFLYTMLSHDISSALETVGLDPAAGFLHTLRPGRSSLALDFIEELRAPLCDRLTLTLFNKGQLSNKDFDAESDAVYLNDRGRRTVLNQWRVRKKEEIQHPFLKEKISIGLIPYTQAMLFARVLRGDLDRYPPFIWR